jgi:hypothetical protein
LAAVRGGAVVRPDYPGERSAEVHARWSMFTTGELRTLEHALGVVLDAQWPDIEQYERDYTTIVERDLISEIGHEIDKRRGEQ